MSGKLLQRLNFYKLITKTLLLTIACCAICTVLAFRVSTFMGLSGKNESNIEVLSACANLQSSPLAKIADESEFKPILSPFTVLMDLAQVPKAESSEIKISNQTGYYPDIYALLNNSVKSIPVSNISDSDEPLVLIIHTHGTEAYDGELNYRSHDISKNVVAVGTVLADELNRLGVNTIHCLTMHDKESYLNSYIRSAETTIAYLERYPSIKYVFDIHRDAIYTSGGEPIKVLSSINGTDVAQVMYVVGTDYKGAVHPKWQTNLTLALKLQIELGTLVRPINLRSASFNQQYSTGSLLIEVGTCANTLAEAKRAALITAQAIYKVIEQ